MRLITDIFQYCKENVPNWNTISISGYHIREAGSTAVQEVAFTLANAIAYVQAALDKGLLVDEFAPQLSFFLMHTTTFWKKLLNSGLRAASGTNHAERFGAKDPNRCFCGFTPRQPALH
jgi:methylmalonyl-CoA mutase N-terminal domain/subunit